VSKFQSISDLEQFKKNNLNKNRNIPLISITSGTCGQARGSLKLIDSFREAVKGFEDKIQLKITGCHGFCEAEPNVIIYPEEIFYGNLQPEDAATVVNSVMENKAAESLLFSDNGDRFSRLSEIPFYASQLRSLLSANALIDPTRIEDYINLDRYKALTMALSMKPDEVVEEIKKSGLRGRGGAGFPTGVKWEITRKQKGDIKYIICNADEGDPGAYMDRSLLEGNPHSVIEGMIIGAYAMGASEGWIYVRNEYPLAVKHIIHAIEQAREYGFLGSNILGSGFDFDLKIARGAGAFVCGEETALIHSIESMRGVPKQRPPFPAQKGLFGKPTNINNVETWANVSHIIERGSDWFSSIGTNTSKGTKIFSLVGQVKNTGLVEVPMGIKLKDVVYKIGGGSPNNREIKAIQTGGPSGGCIPKSKFELEVDYDTLSKEGSIMGSGGMIVMDEDTCMVDMAKYFTNFLQEESCGKCVPCREGTQQMHRILEDITHGRASLEDLYTLEELGQVIKAASMCGLGQTAANPLLSMIKHFRKEFEDHILYRKCNAGVCQELFLSPCQNTCPAGMDVPGYISMISDGNYEEAIRIGRETNPFLSICGRVCDHPCMARCRRNQIDDPLAIRTLKRFIGDYAIENNIKPDIWVSKEKFSEKVAVIGSGPGGLGCAYFLARLGYPVTVFERHDVPGGMLVAGIPSYRLPREVLNSEIELIKELGVEIKNGVTVGEDVKISELLKSGYKAIFVAVGMYGDRELKIPGENADQVIQGVDFLEKVNLGENVEIGKRIAVIGGGNTAIDAARTALRLGAEEVTIVYRRTRKEMPAFEEEINEAIEEGVKIVLLAAPTKIHLGKNGEVEKLECIKMELGDFDTKGRRQPIPIEGSEYTIDVDTVIPAIGEFADIRELFKGLVVDTRRDGTITVNDDGNTNIAGIFAGGDIATGAATVIKAVAAGEKSAIAIDRYLRDDGLRMYPWRDRRTSPVHFDPEAEPVKYNAIKPDHVPASVRSKSFAEVTKGISPEVAKKEADRCLRCDYREEYDSENNEIEVCEEVKCLS